MATVTRATALFAVVSVFMAWSGAVAAQPTQADFDACNREAQAAIQSPAASPRASGTLARGAGAGSMGVGSETPGRADSTGAGASGSVGSSGASGSVSAGPGNDASLHGIASAGRGDAAYQQAYRDCLKRRGF